VKFPAQEYIVTVESFEDGVTVTVTQESECVIGVGSAPLIHEAFDLAHEDYVKELSKYHAIWNSNFDRFP
jgi:hypothetical protein